MTKLNGEGKNLFLKLYVGSSKFHGFAIFGGKFFKLKSCFLLLIVPVRCCTELSRQELKYLQKKDAEMKVFTDKSFEKSQEGKYFKLVTDRISVKEYVNVRFEMTAIPR